MLVVGTCFGKFAPVFANLHLFAFDEIVSPVSLGFDLIDEFFFFFGFDSVSRQAFIHPADRHLRLGTMQFLGNRTQKKQVEQSSDNRCVLAKCPRTCL